MSEAREVEYAELFAYIDHYSTHVSGISPDNPIHPSNVGQRILAQYGKSAALEGLRQAANDTVEEQRDCTPSFIEALDSALREAGIVTFSEIRRRHSAVYRRILKRGSIRDDTEYYLIAGILADATSSASEEERRALEELASQYVPGA